MTMEYDRLDTKSKCHARLTEIMNEAWNVAHAYPTDILGSNKQIETLADAVHDMAQMLRSLCE